MSEKIALDNIEKDEDIYPRQNVKRGLVRRYAEDMKGGDSFPPLVVQRITVTEEDGEEKTETKKTVIMDGWHRKLAYEQYNDWASENGKEPIEKVECTHYKEKTLSKEENLEDLIYASIKYNRKHDFGVSYKDMEQQGIIILKRKPIEKVKRGLKTKIAEKFGITPQAVSQWEEFDEIYQRRKSGKNSLIYRLSQLGWTQKEIGKQVGFSQGRVSEIIDNVSTYITDIQNQFFKKNKSVSEIAEYRNLEPITVWSMVLDGKKDRERFKIFGKSKYNDEKPKVFNVWNFAQCDPRLGNEHPGRIPGQILLNLLYYYTDQGDLVVDPMAGGGSTVDACLVMNRKCRAYDINSKRKDILKRDFNKGFSEKCKDCAFIFLDPPYWNLKDEFYSEESISEESLEDWYTFMRRGIKASYKAHRKEDILLLLVRLW